MKPLLKSGAKIHLTPDFGWSWEAWDGVLDVFSNTKPLLISKDNVILESDVPLFTLLSARSYTAMGFSDVPGFIEMAIFTVDEPTLSKKIKVSNCAPLLISTTGKFTCTYMMPSQKITPGGPIPDPIAVKTGTWKVTDPNQQIVLKIPKGTCIDEKVPDMTHSEKMEAAIGQSNITEAALNELGGAQGIAASLAVSGGLLVAFALIPGGIIVEAVGAALLVAGAAMSGYQIGKGLVKLKDFYEQTDKAQSCAEIGAAGQSFSDGVAEVGIGGVGAALSVLGARKIDIGKSAYSKTLSSTDFIESQSEKKAIDVIEYATQKNGAPRPGFKGGKNFENDGRGQFLPKQDLNGNAITYKEYDIEPYQKGVNRGKERIVIGSDGLAYYTNDHYKTFKPIK